MALRMLGTHVAHYTGSSYSVTQCSGCVGSCSCVKGTWHVNETFSRYEQFVTV